MAEDGLAALDSWERVAGFGVDIPFVRHLGFVLMQFASGQSEISYTPKSEHLNSFGVAALLATVERFQAHVY